MKFVLAVILSVALCVHPVYAMEIRGPILYTDVQETTNTQETTESPKEESIIVSAPSAILMEASTGQVIYEKDADTQRPPASVTKVMTLLLIFDALEEGKISLEDEVTTSEYAASMGGSQVFLEPGEVQTVDTLIKCISVASANDACVTMAEYICGSEEAFVEQMNKRAEKLEMKNTHFVNCNGLPSSFRKSAMRRCQKLQLSFSQLLL